MVALLIRRLVLVFLVSLVIVMLISEGLYIIQKDKTDRAPMRIELVIPTGTAGQVAAGKPAPSLPASMSFVVGDTLVVKNEDQTNHQLGPLFIPAGSSASLVLNQVAQYDYSCTFEPTRYLGLDIYPRTTFWTRLTGLGVAVPPTVAIFFLYSLLVFPVKKAGDQETTPDHSMVAR